MGKNSKKRKGTWTPHPIDGSSETTSGPAGHTDDDGFLDDSRLMKGKRRVDDVSLKRRKKKKKRKDTINNQPANNTAALRQLLGDSFPRRKRSLHFDHLHNDEGEGEDDEEEGQERFADLSDIVATDWRAEARMPPEGSDSSASVMEENDEEIYQSRKLVMRQLVMNQLSFIRQHFSAHQEVDVDDDDVEPPDGDGERQLDRDGASDVDSWAEMEERFAEIYQPIPYDVAMDSWRSMTKEQMLQTVTSRRLRSRMKYMSRAEILGQIQTLKLAQDRDARRKSKSPVYEDMSNTIGAQPSGNRQAADVKKKKRVKAAKAEQQHQHRHHFQAAPLYQNTSSYQGLSLADIYQAKVEARRQELQQMKHQKSSARATAPPAAPAAAGHNDVYVTRAMVHAPPISDDDEDKQRFVSRSSILNKWGTPSTAQEVKSKTELIAQFWRQSDYITTEYSRSLGGGGQQQSAKSPPAHSCSSSSPSSSASCPSDCDCYCDGGDGCSVCSCSSCGSFKTVRSVEKSVIVTQPVKLEQRVDAEAKEKGGASEPIESKTPEPVPLSLVKQRKMEFERLRVLEEQENRLQELVRRTRSDATATAAGPPAHRSWLDLAQRARQLEDKWNSARRSASSAAHAIYEPVPASQLLLKKDDPDKAGRSKNPNRSKKRSKVIKQLKSRMRENLESETLDPRVRQRRHQELQELLSDAVHAGTQTLTNINLGLIYVPMERQLEHVKGKESAKIVGPPGGGLMTLKRDRSQLGGGSGVNGGGGGGSGVATGAITAERLSVGEAGRSTDESEDVFGSIDTLIFEPKAGGSSAVTKAEELEEVEERIAKQFDYLNDYGSCHEGESSDDVAKTTTTMTTTTTDSKNGRRAAAAAVTAASPPRNKNNVIAGAADSASCAAAASCDAFVSERQSTAGDDDDSLASFNSANFQGLHMLKDIHVRIRKQHNEQDDDDDNGRMDSSPASKSEKKSVVSTLDSENYTNVDTDASWDYYPDGLADVESSAADWLKSTAKSGQQQPTSFLAVGNLRKKPPELPTADDETDETAKLLESLRMAEDLNVSSSLRLIFPAKTLKLSPAEGNIFTDVVRDGVESPLQSHVSAEDKAAQSLGQPHDVGFSFTQESEQVVEPDDCRTSRDPILPPPALRKRDTMIRELKMRLREKFHCVGDDASTPPNRLSPIPILTEGGVDLARFPEISKKKTKVMSKLESILSSFNALAQMKGEGRVYRTVDQPTMPFPAEYYTNDVDYESPASTGNAEETDFHSTGYPHHLLQQSMVFQKAASMMSEPTIYDPSLPDDIPLHYPDIPHPMEPLDIQFHHNHHQQQLLARALQDHYMLGLDPRLRDFYDNTLFEQQMEPYAAHEGLYNISNSLEEQEPPHVARKGRNKEAKHHRSGRRTKERDSSLEGTEEEVLNDADHTPTWSEMDSQLFSDQKAAEHLTTAGAFHPPNMTHSRMSPYNDEWLFWEQLNHVRLTEADRRRWEEERSRRMLLWIHHTSQASPSGAVPGSQLPLPHWWQVLE
uniref:Uncharacterized protein n=1 Tax=Daphnia magna TaxID=35525 RepID=A0A0P4Z425_9CRUS